MLIFARRKKIMNNMKKLYGIIVMMMLVSASLIAQTPKGMGTNDPKAKTILDAVSAKFRTYKSVESKFTIKIENAAGKALGTKAGSFFMKGNKYRISATGQEQFSDGSNTWTLDKAAKEVTVNKIDPNANTITPQKLFTNFYDKDYLYKLNGTTNQLSEIELTPVDKTKAIFKILLYVQNSSIVTIKLLEKTGNRYTLGTSGLKINTVVSEAVFVFDSKKYPGIEVVDLR
jgi:outer membrane lipoprotein carrier protein